MVVSPPRVRSSVVVADRIVAADLGAVTPAGFVDLATLGFADPLPACDPALITVLRERVEAAGLPVATGPVLTVSTASGTPAAAAELARRHAPLAEAMEGAGVAQAAARYGRRAAELRTVSNVVGSRTGWDLPRALGSLEAACAAVFAAELPR